MSDTGTEKHGCVCCRQELLRRQSRPALFICGTYGCREFGKFTSAYYTTAHPPIEPGWGPITFDEIADLVNENRRLRSRVDELLTANNAALEENRALKRDRQAVVKLSFDATVVRDALANAATEVERAMHAAVKAHLAA